VLLNRVMVSGTNQCSVYGRGGFPWGVGRLLGSLGKIGGGIGGFLEKSAVCSAASLQAVVMSHRAGHTSLVSKGRKLFVPKSAGTIVPNVSGGGQNKVVNMGGFHVHGVQDADSFKRSSGQLMRQLGNAVGAAQHRG